MNKAMKSHTLTDWRGDAALYRLDPPLDGNEYVVVSSVDLADRFPVYHGEPRSMQIETYIFASDSDGNVEDYNELSGSIKGTLRHADALRDAGYEVSA